MSETVPRSNPRLDNFEANKAAKERENFESEIYGEAGTTDFSDEARRRVEEADAYERHMETLAERPNHDPASAEGARARRTDFINTMDDLNSQESAGYNKEWDDAIAENEAFDAAKVAREEALEAKFATNVKLRQMDAISKELHALRNKEVNPDTIDDDERRQSELEDRLEELLGRYAESEDYDPALADAFMDRDDTAALRRAAERALSEREGGVEGSAEKDSAEKKEKDPVSPEEAKILADVAEITRIIKSDPEAAKKSGAFDKVRELMAQIDAALASAKASEELKEPKDGELSDDDDKIKEPKDGETGEEIKTPKDGELIDDEELKEPKDGELGDDGEEIKTPKDGELIDEDESPRRRGILGVWDRLGLAYAKRGGTPVGLVAHGAERLRSSNKGKVAAVIGGLAVVGALIAGRHYGWFDGGNGTDPNSVTPGQKGGHPGGDGHIDTPPPTPKATPEIPSGDAYAYPWNWMTAAIENGSITPPEGMTAEQALHYYGEKAAEAGHKVEWYNVANGMEAVRVDGSDDTQKVAEILTQFAK